MVLSVAQAVDALRSGLVVAYPTEAVYGLGCDPNNAQAVEHVWQLKQRPAAKGLVLLGGQWQHIEPYMAPLNTQQERALRSSWPGAMTWVVPAASTVPHWVTGGRDTVALRWTSHASAAALCDAFGGALVSTSANLHTQPPCLSAAEVLATFANSAVFAGVCVGDLGGYEKPTPIRELLTGRWVRT